VLKRRQRDCSGCAKMSGRYRLKNLGLSLARMHNAHARMHNALMVLLWLCNQAIERENDFLKSLNERYVTFPSISLHGFPRKPAKKGINIAATRIFSSRGRNPFGFASM